MQQGGEEIKGDRFEERKIKIINKLFERKTK